MRDDLMTPEEFDEVYFHLARSLGDTSSPNLVRDRLVLLCMQELSFAQALELIRKAATETTDA